MELVTKNPARELGIYNRVGSIEVGKAADFVIFDENFNVKHTIINGEIVYWILIAINAELRHNKILFALHFKAVTFFNVVVT